MFAWKVTWNYAYNPFLFYFFLSYICSCRDPDVDVSGAATAIIIVASVKSPDNIQENTTKIHPKIHPKYKQY